MISIQVTSSKKDSIRKIDNIRYYAILAQDDQLGIAKNNEIPWHDKKIRTETTNSAENNASLSLDEIVKNDLAFFRTITYGQMCIVGRKTFEEIIKVSPKAFVNKTALVITRRNDTRGEMPDETKINYDPANKYIFGTPDDINHFLEITKPARVFILGGYQIYEIYKKIVDEVFCSIIPGDFGCDLFSPFGGPKLRSSIFDPNLIYSTAILDEESFENKSDTELYHEIKHMSDFIFYDQTNYDNILFKIKQSSCQINQPITKLVLELMKSGYIQNRTGVPTRNIFNYHFKIDITGIIPLCPVRRHDMNMIFEELMWFIRGDTDIRTLKAKNINIWNDNVESANVLRKSRCGRSDCIYSLEKKRADECLAAGLPPKKIFGCEFLDKCEHCVFEIGRTYGAQWRRFGPQKFDQLAYVINELKRNPSSRRIMLSSWCPPEIFDNACLPPCHVSYNFNVDEYNNLYCQVLQRSSDVAVGLTWNIVSASLFTHMIAKTCGLKAREVSFVLANAHIYKTNETPTKALYVYSPEIYGGYPSFSVKNARENIEDYELSDFELGQYEPVSNIRFKMVV